MGSWAFIAFSLHISTSVHTACSDFLRYILTSVPQLVFESIQTGLHRPLFVSVQVVINLPQFLVAQIHSSNI